MKLLQLSFLWRRRTWRKNVKRIKYSNGSQTICPEGFLGRKACSCCARPAPCPGNLPDSEVTAKVNKQIRHFWCQNDCLSKNSLPHQEVNSKPLTFENNPKKLIFHCFRRSQKNNFNQEQRLRFQPIRERARGCLNQSESTLEMKDGRRPFSQFVRFSISEFISPICFNFPKSNFKVDKLSVLFQLS